MQITREEQAWVLEGLQIIRRRLEYHAQAFESIDPAAMRRACDSVKDCRRLIDRFQNLAFVEIKS